MCVLSLSLPPTHTPHIILCVSKLSLPAPGFEAGIRQSLALCNKRRNSAMVSFPSGWLFVRSCTSVTRIPCRSRNRFRFARIISGATCRSSGCSDSRRSAKTTCTTSGKYSPATVVVAKLQKRTLVDRHGATSKSETKKKSEANTPLTQNQHI